MPKVSVKDPGSSTERLHALVCGALQAILPVRSQHAFERATVLGDFAPLRYCALVLLDMILNSIGLFADQECLDRALSTFSQLDCMAWKLRDFGAVPLEARKRQRHTLEERRQATGGTSGTDDDLRARLYREAGASSIFPGAMRSV